MKKTLLVDFDGVVHSYESGWVEADFVPDPPVAGAMEFLHGAIKKFDVKIYSSRSSHAGGTKAMKTWLQYWAKKQLPEAEADVVVSWTEAVGSFPTDKPAAFLTIDDRCVCFDGQWPDLDVLLEFKPWNKK